MAHSGRLGVEAALVDGQLLPGDVEVADGRIAAVGLERKTGKRHRGSRLHRPAGERVRGRRLLRRGHGGLPSRRGSAARVRRDRIPADLHHLPEEELTAALREVPQNG